MVVGDPINPIASLVLIDVNVDRDVDIAITFCVWIVTYRDSVRISLIYIVVPVVEPLIIVTASTSAITSCPDLVITFVYFITIIESSIPYILATWVIIRDCFTAIISVDCIIMFGFACSTIILINFNDNVTIPFSQFPS